MGIDFRALFVALLCLGALCGGVVVGLTMWLIPNFGWMGAFISLIMSLVVVALLRPLVKRY